MELSCPNKEKNITPYIESIQEIWKFGYNQCEYQKIRNFEVFCHVFRKS